MAHGPTSPFDLADVQLHAYDTEIEHLNLIRAIRAHIAALPDQPGPLTLLEYTAICPGLIRMLGCARWQHDPTYQCPGVLHPEFLYHDGRISWMPRMVLCRQHQRHLGYGHNCPNQDTCWLIHGSDWGTTERLAWRELVRYHMTSGLGLVYFADADHNGHRGYRPITKSEALYCLCHQPWVRESEYMSLHWNRDLPVPLTYSDQTSALSVWPARPTTPTRRSSTPQRARPEDHLTNSTSRTTNQSAPTSDTVKF